MSDAERRRVLYARASAGQGRYSKVAHGQIPLGNAILPRTLHLHPTHFPVMSELLDSAEIKAWMKKLPEWEHEKKHIERLFEFDEFAESIDFVNALAEIAEDEEHHPD